MSRRKNIRFLFLAGFTLLFLFSCSPKQLKQCEVMERSPLANSRQVLLALADSWESQTAEVEMLERGRLGSPWHSVGFKSRVNLGRNGLGWGTGLHGFLEDPGPVKQEGDGKAPAGVFKISAIFGYSPAGSVPFFHLPYIPIDSRTICVDDVQSAYYNLVLDGRVVSAVDWNSSEQMLRRDNLYKWGALVEHNPMPRKFKGGSCIFLHLWKGPSIPTAGCTAFDEADLMGVLRWLRPEAGPVLVQLPRSAYLRLRAAWQLP